MRGGGERKIKLIFERYPSCNCHIFVILCGYTHSSSPSLSLLTQTHKQKQNQNRAFPVKLKIFQGLADYSVFNISSLQFPILSKKFDLISLIPRKNSSSSFHTKTNTLFQKICHNVFQFSLRLIALSHFFGLKRILVEWNRSRTHFARIETIAFVPFSLGRET